jgi:hypothetical protein
MLVFLPHPNKFSSYKNSTIILFLLKSKCLYVLFDHPSPRQAALLLQNVMLRDDGFKI